MTPKQYVLAQHPDATCCQLDKIDGGRMWYVTHPDGERVSIIGRGSNPRAAWSAAMRTIELRLAAAVESAKNPGPVIPFPTELLELADARGDVTRLEREVAETKERLRQFEAQLFDARAKLAKLDDPRRLSPLRHSTNEHGDCPSWCKACEVERQERSKEAEPAVDRQLLVMACSATKRDDAEDLPALDRYDGPSYKVLRNYLAGREPWEVGLDVWILSAEFGLIHWQEPIPTYDRRMDKERARDLRAQVVDQLERLTADTDFDEVFLMMGRDYLEAVEPFGDWLRRPNSVIIPEGGIGYKLGALKSWLNWEAADADTP